MRIREAHMQDLDSLASLLDLYRQFYETAADLAAAREFLEQRMTRKESVIFVAETNGDLTGFVQLYPSFSSTRLKRQWILNDLFVRETDRKNGTGEALLRRAMDFGTRDGSRGLTLMTAVTNERARRLYEKLGWKKNETFLTYNFYL